MKKKENSIQEDQSSRIVIDDFKSIETIDSGNVFAKCHTFKLAPAVMLKNIGHDPRKPYLVQMEHCHIFHTFDSSGRRQTKTNSVGGHYHEVTLKEVDGKLSITVSPAISNRDSENITKLDTPYKGILKEKLDKDVHTHETIYLKSEELKIRNVSADVSAMVSRYQSQFKDD